jgi:nitroreductase
MYPPDLVEPYRERRVATAERRYAALGVARTDTGARARVVAGNWQCFGAPAALFCYIHRTMGPAQWADVGMYLQTVMLLLRAEGLHSCPQLAWTVYHESVARVVSPPADLVLVCGVCIGYRRPGPVPEPTRRAELSENVTFLGDRRSEADADARGSDRNVEADGDRALDGSHGDGRERRRHAR